MSEVKELVTSLLRDGPGAPHSVQLEIDTDGDIHAFFEVLLMIMTELLKAWYEPPITLGVISEKHLDLLKGYFASFGIKFHLEVDEEPRIIAIRNRDYLQKSRLDQMKFQTTTNGNLYTVWFSNLPVA